MSESNNLNPTTDSVEVKDTRKMSYQHVQGLLSVAMVLALVVGFIFGFIVGKADEKRINSVVEAAGVTEATEAESTVPDTTEEIEAPEVTEGPTEPEPETIPVDIPQVAYYDIPLSKDLQNHIFQICESRNIDPSIALAMIFRESTYRDYLIGDNGNSFGLMQIQPRWHQARMDRLGCTNLLDPYQNVTVGLDLFGDLMSTGKGVEWALMAYNGGGTYADKKASQGVVTDYAKSVLQKAAELESAKYYE